jgi:PIN domain-containing protein
VGQKQTVSNTAERGLREAKKKALGHRAKYRIGAAQRAELMIRTRPTLPDPNDEMVPETAINGRAGAIVTFNEENFRPVATRFRCSGGFLARNSFRIHRHSGPEC